MKSLDRAALAFAAGTWVGVADGVYALLAYPELASSIADRAISIALCIALDGIALAAVFVPASHLFLVMARRVGGVRAPGGAEKKVARAAMLAAAAACGVGLGIAVLGAGGVHANGGKHPNVVLISIDTLRQSHLSAYGYARATSPNLEGLARRGVLFENAYSQSNWTVASHTSMFTGLDPLEHGVLGIDHGMAPAFTTLAERLKAEGFSTVGFVGTRHTGVMGSERGFDQGFDLYSHYPHPHRYRIGFLARKLDHLVFVRVRQTVGMATPEIDSARSWLRNQRSEPFFMFIHLWDLHSKEFKLPYQAPEPFFDLFCPGELQNYDGCIAEGRCATKYLREISDGVAKPPAPAEIAKMICLYDGSIGYVDHEIGRLLRTLTEEGLDDETIVVITADHGEHFYEHRRMLHRSLYEEALRVPLIIRTPGGVSGKRVKEVVYQTDLVPTLLELIGLPTDPRLRGRSLAQTLLSWPVEPADPGLRISHNPSMSTVLREGPLKYIRNYGLDPSGQGVSKEELYDLLRDPREQRNLALSMPDAITRFRAEFEREKASSRSLQGELLKQGGHLEIIPTEAQMEQLRALGYGD